MLSQLFTPYDIKGLTLPNRFAMAPMTRKQSPGGIPTPTVADYYRRRAAAGVGLIITEGTLPEHPLAAHDTSIPRIAEDTTDGWRLVLNGIRPTGSKTFVQIWHQGPKAKPGIGATAIAENGETVVKKAVGKSKQELFDAFVKASVLAKQIGFDGIELHGAHGYLLDSFLRAGQVSFVCDLVREVKICVGSGYPICMRFSQWDAGDFEARQFHTPQDLESVLLPLKDSGVDIFHASTRRFWLPEFDDSDLNLAGWTKKITNAPTITVGNIGLVTSELMSDGVQSFSELMRRYDNGEFDMVAIGRPLISDPDWCRKVQDGKENTIIDYTDETKNTYP
ncbi:MAG: 12-oxophytodienoate reductase [Candidatus Latescibacterota bacterium]|nr:12-oxophytodienoate reductase [Candidatus Latescibacterota bacterium]